MRALLIMSVLCAGLVAATPATVAAQDPVPADDLAAFDARHGRSRLSMELVSRSYDAPAQQWVLVLEARLDSRAICLPLVFDCIVEPQARPSGATLTDVECVDPWWGHLGIFTDRCMKQLFFAGHDQTFRFTYRTDAGSDPDALTIGARFGRGVVPIILQQLASTELTVDLRASLDVAKDCPDTTVGPGAPIECELTVTYAGQDAGPVTVAELADTVSDPSLIEGATLTTTDPDWTCPGAGAPCGLTGSIEAGDSVVFDYAATAADTQDGGDVENTATLTYETGPDTLVATSVDRVTVTGRQDTVLDIVKTADAETARPGDRVSWTVTVANVGVPGGVALDASSVVLTDVASGVVSDLTIAQVDGVGTWTCSDGVCTTPSMPPGTTTFRATGTLSSTAVAGDVVVNQTDVRWTNDVFGPDHPAVAGATLSVAQAPPSPTPAPARPASLAFTG
jgi:uncharacterized repeat protein (TIGR01451 family)